MLRRNFLFASGALFVAGCQTTTAPQAGAPRPKSAPAGTAQGLNTQSMRIVDVDVVERRGGGRPFIFAGFTPQRVYGVLSAKVQSALNAANPAGTRPTRAVVTLSAIKIATKGGRKADYDSVIIARAEFIDVETGTKIGEGRLGAQATYRPGFLGSQDKVLTPEEELQLITSHSTQALAKHVFG